MSIYIDLVYTLFGNVALIMIVVGVVNPDPPERAVRWIMFVELSSVIFMYLPSTAVSGTTL